MRKDLVETLLEFIKDSRVLKKKVDSADSLSHKEAILLIKGLLRLEEIENSDEQFYLTLSPTGVLVLVDNHTFEHEYFICAMSRKVFFGSCLDDDSKKMLDSHMSDEKFVEKVLNQYSNGQLLVVRKNKKLKPIKEEFNFFDVYLIDYEKV